MKGWYNFPAADRLQKSPLFILMSSAPRCYTTFLTIGTPSQNTTTRTMLWQSNVLTFWVIPDTILWQELQQCFHLAILVGSLGLKY
jgi:hypothetical protein